MKTNRYRTNEQGLTARLGVQGFFVSKYYRDSIREAGPSGREKAVDEVYDCEFCPSCC